MFGAVAKWNNFQNQQSHPRLSSQKFVVNSSSAFENMLLAKNFQNNTSHFRFFDKSLLLRTFVISNYTAKVQKPVCLLYLCGSVLVKQKPFRKFYHVHAARFALRKRSPCGHNLAVVQNRADSAVERKLKLVSDKRFCLCFLIVVDSLSE